MDTDPPLDDTASMAAPLDDLRAELDIILADESLRAPGRPHLRLLTLTCALISEALRRGGMTATLVGGGAIEFHAPGAFATDDADLVVEPASGLLDRKQLHEVFASLGFERSARHWVRDGFFVEVPGTRLEDPFSEFPVGPYTLRVVEIEVVLVGRLVEFDQTGHTGHGAQAVAMLRVFSGQLDGSLLASLLRRERADKVFQALKDLAETDEPMADEILRETWDRLRGRKPYFDPGESEEEE